MSSLNGNSPAHAPAPGHRQPAAGALVPVGGLAVGDPSKHSGSMAELRRRRTELAERVAGIALIVLAATFTIQHLTGWTQ